MYNPINCPDIDKKHEARGADRFELFTEAEGLLSSRGAEPIVVHNLSATGVLLETETLLHAGQRIHISMSAAEPTAAIVVWTGDALYGCRFEHPISQEMLSTARKHDLLAAAEIASELAPAAKTMPAMAATADSEPLSLSVRLRTLREARGLSLAALSRRAGISKPSIWAWETGKTVPRVRSIEALARALCVDAADIWGNDAAVGQVLPATVPTLSGPSRGGGAEPLDRVIASARASIAAAAAVRPERVRITVEF